MGPPPVPPHPNQNGNGQYPQGGNYAAPQYNQPPPEYGQNGQGYAPPPDFNKTFKIEKPKYNDIWAGLLFIAVFCGFCAVSGITINGYDYMNNWEGGSIYDSKKDFGLSSNTVILFAFVIVIALVVSYAYMLAARVFTKQFIWMCIILNIALGIGTAIVYFVRKYYSAAVVFLIFSIFYIVCFMTWIPRIPFSVLMLQTVIDVAKHHGHVFMVSFIGGLVALGFGAWFSVTLVAVYAKFRPGNNPACSEGVGGCSNATVIGLVVFVTFAGYWITEFIKNVVHTTIAGVYGSWFFCAGKPGGVPKGATRGAFRRSMTYSFGSISFGSLIVSLIQLLRQAISLAENQQRKQGNMIAYILLCVLQCFVGILDWAIQFLNHYAFSHIALYGKAFIPAAKDTWRLIKDRGMDALVNQCLIDPVLTTGATFVAYLCAFLAYLYIEFTKPAYNADGSFTPLVMAYAFLIGLQAANVFFVPLKSGVATFFVAAAWDPQVLMTDHPDLYHRMVAVYPHVQQAIHA